MTVGRNGSGNSASAADGLGICSHGTCTNRAWRWGKGMCVNHARAVPGHLDRRVDAERVHRHLHACIDQGATPAGIAEGCQVSLTNVIRHCNGEAVTIAQSLAAKLMQATNAMSGHKVPTWPTRRRLRSLRAAGWQIKQISEQTGIHRATLSKLSGDNSTHTTPEYAATVAAFFADHLEVVGPMPRAALAGGWPLPIDWVNIDDPDEQPTRHSDDSTADNAAPAASRRRSPIPREVIDTMRWAVHTANQEHIHRSHGQGTRVVGERLGLPHDKIAEILAGKIRTLPTSDLDRVMVRLGVTGTIIEEQQAS
jgi:hypothetical protein